MIAKMLVCFAGITLSSALAAPNPAESAIKAVIYSQQAAWNRGDTEAYLKAYSASAVVVSGKITHGIDEIRVLYQTIYPTLESMGHLEFSDVEIHTIDPAHAYAIDRWKLDRKPADGGTTEGFHTIVFAKTPAGWKIVLDHAS
ncbi:MAG: YybH family protein [Bryobacteraceae bacterium]